MAERLTVKQAQKLCLCRICGGKMSAVFILNYGAEFAHEDCLKKKEEDAVAERLIPFDPATAKPGDVILEHRCNEYLRGRFIGLDNWRVVFRLDGEEHYRWRCASNLRVPAPPEPERRWVLVVSGGVHWRRLLTERDTAGAGADWSDGIPEHAGEALAVLRELWESRSISGLTIPVELLNRVRRVLGIEGETP